MQDTTGPRASHLVNSFALVAALAVSGCGGGGDAPGQEAALGSGMRIATPGTAKGNSDAAHRCQKGGYKLMVGADGESFRNVGECVSFAAKGGKFLPTSLPRYAVIRLAPYGHTTGINNIGQVVGAASETGSSPQYGFLYHEGHVTNLNALNGGGFVYPTDINDLSVVVGVYDTSRPELGDRGFAYHSGKFQTLHAAIGMPYAINNHGQIVGAGGTTSVLVQPEGDIIDLGTLPGAEFSFATDINNNGRIVGSWSGSYGLSRAFLYSDGVMVDLGIGPSSAMAINDRGQIVGSTYRFISDTVRSESRAFLYSDGEFTQLEGLPGVNSPDDAARSINSSGQIAGNVVGPYPSNDQYGVLWIDGKPVKLNDLVDVNEGWHIQNPKINDNGDIAADGCIFAECGIPLLLNAQPREP